PGRHCAPAGASPRRRAPPTMSPATRPPRTATPAGARRTRWPPSRRRRPEETAAPPWPRRPRTPPARRRPHHSCLRPIACSWRHRHEGAELVELRFTDAAHLHQFADGAKAAVTPAVVENRLGRCRTDTRQGVELLGGRGVEVEQPRGGTTRRPSIGCTDVRPPCLASPGPP